MTDLAKTLSVEQCDALRTTELISTNGIKHL
jgi:hypothetical protein